MHKRIIKSKPAVSNRQRFKAALSPHRRQEYEEVYQFIKSEKGSPYETKNAEIFLKLRQQTEHLYSSKQRRASSANSNLRYCNSVRVMKHRQTVQKRLFKAGTQSAKEQTIPNYSKILQQQTEMLRSKLEGFDYAVIDELMPRRRKSKLLIEIDEEGRVKSRRR